MLYFAYGSNLEEENWALRCQRKGFHPSAIEALGPVTQFNLGWLF